MKLLVIGYGSIGKRHAKNARLFADVGVFDETQNYDEESKNELNLMFFDSLELAFQWSPDGVIVATPTHTHIEVSNKVLNAGFDLLIEKPISNEIKEAEKLIQKAKKLNIEVFVVCNMRFHDGIQSLTQNLHKVGNPTFARAHVGSYLPNRRPNVDYRKNYSANHSMGGGVVLDAIHEIDYLINCFGPVVKTKSTIKKLSNLEIDVEDYAEIIMIHKNNVHVALHMDYLRPFKRRGCEIVGEKGMLLWSSEGKNPENCEVTFYSNNFSEKERLFKKENIDSNSMYVKLIENFCNALNRIDNNLLRAEEALEELLIVEKIKKNKGFN